MMTVVTSVLDEADPGEVATSLITNTPNISQNGDCRRPAEPGMEPTNHIIAEEQVTCDLEDASRSNPENRTQRKGWTRRKKCVVSLAVVMAVVFFSFGVLVGCNIPSSGDNTSAQLNKSLSIRNTEHKLPPIGWVRYNNTSYYYSEEKLNWASSKMYCEQNGAMLAVLTDPYIKENVKRFRKDGDDQWIGSYKESDEWKWLNETSVGDERLNRISGENCRTWNPRELWEGDCSKENHFICVRVQ